MEDFLFLRLLSFLFLGFLSSAENLSIYPRLKNWLSMSGTILPKRIQFFAVAFDIDNSLHTSSTVKMS